MKRVIICIIIIFFFNLPAAAIGYDDFPPNIQQIIDERIAELTSNGGVCIAGRVTMDDETHIGSGKDVQINLICGTDEPLWIYNDGWFVMGRTLQPSRYAIPGRLVLRAFGYDPIDTPITILEGEMTYVEFVMNGTPYEDMALITGTVVNEQNEPVDGAMVSLSFPLASHGIYEQPYMSIVTGLDGQYLFEDLSTTKHNILASASGCAYHRITVTPSASETVAKDLTLYPNRKAVIDYVYQADGSCSFIGGNLQAGTIEWINGTGGIDFSDGGVEQYKQGSLRDIEMKQDCDMLNFRIFYCNGKNGFYDAGAVDFESVTDAAESGYLIKEKPCVVGHVYVIRTYEDNYAKFTVRSISENE